MADNEELYEEGASCSGDCSGCESGCSSAGGQEEYDFRAAMNEYSNVKKVIGVISGKGGVGKSFVTSALATLLNRRGYSTAILDADITGPSIPKSFGIKKKVGGNEMGIIPAESKNGIRVMSVNLLLDDEETPVIWRGPVVAGTVKQFWSEVVWGEVDYMFVDMPPGTGDVPLTVFQSLPVDGIVIVTSPQDLVSMIVTKALNMAKMMNVPILGLVENYSYVTCPDCGKKIEIFGKSHIDEIAAKYQLKCLAKLPLEPRVANAIDEGMVEDLGLDELKGAADFIEKVYDVGAPAENSTAHEVTIAVATDENGMVCQHFGKTKTFTLFTVENKKLVAQAELGSAGEGHESSVNVLKSSGASVLICGGLGGPAMEALKAAGMTVIPGTIGDVKVAVQSYLDGALIASDEANCECDGDGDHDHDGDCHCNN